MENIFLVLHILVLAVTLVGIALADHEAFNWFRGKTQTLDPVRMRRYHRWVWTGLILMILTGIGIAYPVWSLLSNNPAFYIKMAFVLVLLINSVAIHSFMDVALQRPYVSLSRREKFPLLLSGGASTLGWLGAIVAAGFLLP